MFENNIRLYGKHAAILKKYSKDKQAEDHYKFIVVDNKGTSHDIFIFETMIQAYMVAAMIGIINKKTINADEGNDPTANIFSEVLNKNRSALQRIVQLIYLTNEEIDDIDLRIKEAFSIKNKNNIDKVITNYARFGLEVIDDYFKECATYEDVINAILDLRADYSVRV